MLSTTDFYALIDAAVQAPSSHNTQPWLFAMRGDSIGVIADRRRALPVNDPRDRELTISCGCALFNLRVAAAAMGYSSVVTLLPDPADDDLLVRITLAQSTVQLPEAALRPAIESRRTYRERFAAEDVGEAAVERLTAAAAAEGATLIVLDTISKRLDAADLVVEGDAIQWASPSWRRELGAWMHPRRQGDGLSLPALAVPVAQVVVRTFDMGQGVGAKDRQLADESPLLTVLATADDTARDWLQAGQALERALLTGVQMGLQASYLNQPIQIDALRPRLRQQTEGSGHPQLLIRWGRPTKEVRPAPRRPVADVIEQ